MRPRLRDAQPQQPCVCVPETTTFIEGPEARLVVDMEPLAPCLLHLYDETLHQGSTDSPPLALRVNRGVEQEGVVPSVPDGMHEAHEPLALERSYPADAEPSKPIGPRQHRPR